jgi:hypothetical protein
MFPRSARKGTVFAHMPTCCLTFEFTRLRKRAKPAVAGRVQRRVRPRRLSAGYRWLHWTTNAGAECKPPSQCGSAFRSATSRRSRMGRGSSSRTPRLRAGSATTERHNSVYRRPVGRSRSGKEDRMLRAGNAERDGEWNTAHSPPYTLVAARPEPRRHAAARTCVLRETRALSNSGGLCGNGRRSRIL